MYPLPISVQREIKESNLLSGHYCLAIFDLLCLHIQRITVLFKFALLFFDAVHVIFKGLEIGPEGQTAALRDHSYITICPSL